MTVHFSSRQVTFRRPFILDGLASPQPAGTYLVETAVVFDDRGRAGRRTTTFIKVKKGVDMVLVIIDPSDLNAALARDALGVAIPARRQQPAVAATTSPVVHQPRQT